MPYIAVKEKTIQSPDDTIETEVEVQFDPDGPIYTGNVGESIFDIAWRNDVDVATACVGQGNCGLCRIKILEGEEILSPYSDIEESHLGNVYFLTKERLACQCILQSGRVTVGLLDY